MSQFVTADEATLRWANLETWYKLQGHFWLGTGPFYLNKAFPVEKSLSMLRNPDYPDSASRWAIFGTPMVPVVTVDGPAVVSIGTEAVFNVAVTFNDQPYPADKIDVVKYLVFDAAGAVVAQGDATAGAAGQYTITLAADVTAKLVAGSNKLEVVTTSLAVSIPAITDFEFVAK
jgi:peptide/nickel transport system substrate-binding protein